MAVVSLSIGLDARSFKAGKRQFVRDADEVMGKAKALTAEFEGLQSATKEALSAVEQSKPAFGAGRPFLAVGPNAGESRHGRGLTETIGRTLQGGGPAG